MADAASIVDDTGPAGRLVKTMPKVNPLDAMAADIPAAQAEEKKTAADLAEEKKKYEATVEAGKNKELEARETFKYGITPPKLIEPPKYEPKDPMAAMMGTTGLLVSMAGMLGRRSATNMLNATASAMEGMKQANEEQFKKDLQNVKEANENAMRTFEWEHKSFREILDDIKAGKTDAWSHLTTMANAHDNAAMKVHTANKDYESALKQVEQMDIQRKQLGVQQADFMMRAEDHKAKLEEAAHAKENRTAYETALDNKTKIDADPNATKEQKQQAQEAVVNSLEKVDPVAARTLMARGATEERHLTDDALKAMYDNWKVTGSKPTFGYGKGAVADREAYNNMLPELMKQDGYSMDEIAAFQAEFQGNKAAMRTLATREANIFVAADEAAQLAPLALDASNKFDRTGIKSLNDIQKKIDSGTASPELRQFEVANTGLVTAYSQVMSRGNVTTDSSRAHAYDILNTGFSKGDYAAAVSQLQKEIEAAKKAPKDIRHMFETEWTHKKGEESKSPPKITTQAEFDAIPSGTIYTEEDGKQYRKP